MSVKVKICGLTRIEDVQMACNAGADFCGIVVEVSGAKRSQEREKAKLLFEVAKAETVIVTRSKTTKELVELVKFLSPFAIQLHGDEKPELVADMKAKVDCRIWKAIPLPAEMKLKKEEIQSLLLQIQNFLKAGCDALVLDTATAHGFGGTGVTSCWELAAELVRQLDVPCFLAGGLTPENVSEAIKIVKPFGVDVSSGVELSLGIKDAQKMKIFCMRAKGMEKG
ncbi:MAG: phosphoribosylanthranilate isomerase [Armatimonadetes bacterium]|nr:phosphoribosylanthranilate isomerase [Armatimonadota bacterium]